MCARSSLTTPPSFEARVTQVKQHRNSNDVATEVTDSIPERPGLGALPGKVQCAIQLAAGRTVVTGQSPIRPQVNIKRAVGDAGQSMARSQVNSRPARLVTLATGAGPAASSSTAASGSQKPLVGLVGEQGAAYGGWRPMPDRCRSTAGRCATSQGASSFGGISGRGDER
jgi:hypothetical protein